MPALCWALAAQQGWSCLGRLDRPSEQRPGAKRAWSGQEQWPQWVWVGVRLGVASPAGESGTASVSGSGERQGCALRDSSDQEAAWGRGVDPLGPFPDLLPARCLWIPGVQHLVCWEKDWASSAPVWWHGRAPERHGQPLLGCPCHTQVSETLVHF